MNLESSFSFDFGNLNETYFKLLAEEDFDFKTKNINFDVKFNDKVEVKLVCSNILDLKIATTALIKSLEVIDKTLNI